ncbi:MarR family winged helix-turn-helix transcriptional regulator [Pararhodospirillum photometricum]|nr:MarR family transcriptional regulator [Pararhodospirillum photometricum]
MAPKAEKTTATPALPGLDDLVGYHLRRASIVDLQGASAALEAVRSRPVPFSVLSCIVERPGISAAEICRVLGMQRANIVSILAELEERGLFLREADSRDNRIQRLFPTRHGQDVAAQGIERVAQHEEVLLQHLSVEERHELRRLLAKIWQ